MMITTFRMQGLPNIVIIKLFTLPKYGRALEIIVEYSDHLTVQIIIQLSSIGTEVIKTYRETPHC